MMCPLNDNCSCHEDETPQRIQLRRTRGWRLPEGAVKVDRSTPWGNPFTVAGAIEAEFATNEDDARKLCAETHRSWLLQEDRCLSDVVRSGKHSFDRRWVEAHLSELAGRDLACWCAPGEACHADLLLELANKS